MAEPSTRDIIEWLNAFSNSFSTAARRMGEQQMQIEEGLAFQERTRTMELRMTQLESELASLRAENAAMAARLAPPPPEIPGPTTLAQVGMAEGYGSMIDTPPNITSSDQ